MRKALLPVIIIISAVVILARIFYLQVIEEDLKLKAENNAIKKVFSRQNNSPHKDYCH